MDKVVSYTTPVAPPCGPNSTPIFRASTHASELVVALQETEINNAYELFQKGCRLSRTRPCLGTRRKIHGFDSTASNGTTDNPALGDYEYLQYGEVELMAQTFGSGLLRKKLVHTITYEDEVYEPARELKPIGICSKNRLEWFITDIACQAYGLASVPLYDTLGATAMVHILKLTSLTCIAGATENLLGILTTLEEVKDLSRTHDGSDSSTTGKNDDDTVTHSDDDGENDVTNPGTAPVPARRSHNLKAMIVYGELPLPQELVRKARAMGIEVFSWSDIIQEGKNGDILPTAKLQRSDVLGICFTSGTTGVPKGVILTHGMFVSTICAAMRGPLTTSKDMLTERDCYISYLPLAHVLERILVGMVLSLGAQVAIYSGEARTLLDDIKMARPTIFVSVPRLFMRIHEKIMHGVGESSFLARYLFNKGMEAKLKVLRSDAITEHSFWDRVVFRKTKALMGGRLRFMLSGGAALDVRVQEELACCFCCPMVEGYGMTETLGATFIRNMHETVYGHIGGQIPALEMRLESAPEMEYFADRSRSPDGLERGEIYLRGAPVMPNYFRNVKDTKLVKTEDGWFKTGDIAVRLREGGRMKIIDRRKDIFKLSQGEYIAPERIENAYVGAELICHAFVYGDSSRNNLVGIFCVDEEMAKKWATEREQEQPRLKGIAFENLIRLTEFQTAVESQIRQEEIAHKFNGFEKVKAFHLETEQFSVDNGLLTPTFKLRRNNAKKRYWKDIQNLFDRGTQRKPSTKKSS